MDQPLVEIKTSNGLHSPVTEPYMEIGTRVTRIQSSPLPHLLRRPPPKTASAEGPPLLRPVHPPPPAQICLAAAYSAAAAACTLQRHTQNTQTNKSRLENVQWWRRGRRHCSSGKEPHLLATKDCSLATPGDSTSRC
eukprot:scaffold13967_cov32-Tisochrysis_lutea.AAC.4